MEEVLRLAVERAGHHSKVYLVNITEATLPNPIPHIDMDLSKHIFLLPYM